MTTVDADNLVTIKHVSMTSNVTSELDKITPGSEILLHLQVESHFPQGNIDLVPTSNTLPTAEILSDKNARVFLVYGFLMKSFKKHILKI